MPLLDNWKENEKRLREAGALAIAEAKAAGVPVYYSDATLGPGIVKEMPDGHRLLLNEAEVDDELEEVSRSRR